jgi:thiamine-monophosphate kinase
VNPLSAIGEDALIERIVRLVPQDPAPGARPGDDCAVVDPGPHSATLTLLKTDALVAGVHFTPQADPRRVGWKAAARVISDFAAMGGRPGHFLVTIALPGSTEVAWVEALYGGIGDCLRAFGGCLAGGETSAVPEGSAAVISVAATGEVARGQLVTRGGGRTGDAVFVTGTLGGSIHGKHLDFTPRLDASAWLVSHFPPTAMMDLSDGLAKDMPRLAAASGCGFLIEASSLPLTAGCTPAGAAGDGEDYELLFTLPPERRGALLAAWPAAFPELPLTAIGTLAEPGTTTVLGGGWEHFRKA